jgi:hypothetical protein
MVLRMACPTKRKGSDNWYYRRTIPADVRAILEKVAKERRPRGWYKTHISISLRTADRAAAKTKCPEIAAEVERQLKALREGPKPLTTKQIAALSGNLLSFALAIDALITPTIPQPVRRDYMIALLGQRFIGREVYSRTVMRYQSRRVKTGVIRYGPNGPEELTRWIEEEVPVKEYFRIRRADMRYVGRQLWKTLEKTSLSGGREGADWTLLKGNFLRAIGTTTAPMV